MKKIALLAMIICMMASCKKADEVKKNACGIPDYTITVDKSTARIIITNIDGEPFAYSLVHYGPVGFDPARTGYLQALDSVRIYDLVNGKYDVYVEGNCGPDNFTELVGPKSFLVTNGKYVNVNCGKPANVTINESLNLELNWNTGNNANYYEVAYGLQGFNPDTAQHFFSSSNRYNEFAVYKDKIYDYYVRSNCGGNGYSEWSDVKTFKANFNYNVITCKPIKGFTWNMASDKTITVEWSDTTGIGWQFSYNKGTNSQTGPTSSVTYSLVEPSEWFQSNGKPQTIYVYLRSKCEDGNYTSWYNDSIVIQ